MTLARLPLGVGLLLAALVCPSVAQPTPARDSAWTYVGNLRARVSVAQRLYGESLAADAVPTAKALDRVQSLRAELRHAILTSAKQGTGSESVLAGSRAEIESLLDVIHAYEAVIGRPPGARTTAWNVLTPDELVAFRSEAIQHQVAVQMALDSLPSSERPPFLLARQREIASWIEEIDHETVFRAGSEARGPPEIPSGISISEARTRYPSITATEQQAGSLFERHLAFQVELRLTNSPGDASLGALRDLLPKVPGPVYRVAPKRPPPTVQETMADLEQALREEKDATILRDPVRRARARARIQGDLKWLEVSRVAGDSHSPWGADLVNVETLTTLRKDYDNWRFRLLQESGGVSTEDSTFELEHVRRRIAEIDAALDRRAFGWNPDGTPPQEDLVVRPRGPRPSAPIGKGSQAVRAYEIGMERDRLSWELGYLKLEADIPGSVTNVGLQKAVETTDAELRAEMARLAARSKATLDQVERNVLQNGRGTQAAEEGARLLEAKRSIAAGADPAVVVPSIENSPYFKPRAAAPSTLAVLTENPSAPNAVTGKAKLLEIPIRRGPVLVGAPATRDVADFEDLFPRTERPQDGWTRSFKGVMEDLQRAPGGIVIDAKLTAPLAARIQQANFDPASGALTLQIDGHAKKVEPALDAETIRIAYAFVKDGRVMPMDLRNINNTESLLLAHQIVPKRDLGPSDWQKIDEALNHFTAVNAHPAIRDTGVAMQMIWADQFIFDLLPDGFDINPLYGSSVRFGLDIAPLRSIYQKELFSLANPDAWRALFQKSILSVVDVRAEAGEDRVRLDPQLRFAIFRLPSAKNAGPGFPMEKATAWLQQHEAEFKTRPVLEPLIRFAGAVAVIRTVLDAKVPNNLDEVLGVAVKAVPTPRLLCRSEDRNPCGLANLQMTVGK